MTKSDEAAYWRAFWHATRNDACERSALWRGIALHAPWVAGIAIFWAAVAYAVISA